MNQDENPFQPPTEGRAATGVNSGNYADLKGIAKSQKGIMVCILIYFIAMVGQFAIPIEYRPFIGLGMLINGVVGMVFVFLLATTGWYLPVDFVYLTHQKSDGYER